MKNLIIVICIMALGYYFYHKNEQSNSSVSALKNLLDKVDSSPVTSEDAKPVFKTMMTIICETNDKDPNKPSGTLEQCISKLENTTNKMCSDKVFGSAQKRYNSKSELKSDFHLYFSCAVVDLETAR